MNNIIKELIGINITMVAWMQELGLHNQEVLIKQLGELSKKMEEQSKECLAKLGER